MSILSGVLIGVGIIIAVYTILHIYGALVDYINKE